jgi:adenosine/AMP kinase
MKLEITKIHTPNALSVVLGKFHFTKTFDDINVTLSSDIPGIRFGLACYKSSGCSGIGTDSSMIESAKNNASNLGVEQLFVLFVENTIPKRVLNALKKVPEINEIYCATSEPVEVIITHNDQARTVMGLANGYSTCNK